MYDFNEILKSDPEIADAIQLEMNRQNDNIELIASENFVSKAVMAAMGSPLTNKYAEGYPNKRYYGGCKYVDISESLAIERAKKLFGANFANVQPHSGAQANMAAFYTLVSHNDTVLGMNLAHGGHLTHGSSVNFSGRDYNIVPYGVTKEGFIDYDELLKLATTHKPKMIIAGASAYPRMIDFKIFSEIAKEVSAYLMVDMAHIAGLVAAGLHMNPVPYADIVTSTTHKTLRGPRGGLILCNDEQLAKKIDKAIFPGIQGGPLEHVIAAKAISFKEASGDDFKIYSTQVIKNSQALAKTLVSNGFDLVSGGTDNHLMLVDLSNKNVTGKETEHLLDSVNITCNKNAVPFDKKSPFITSGIRLGTAASTTRGFLEEDMIEIGNIISMIILDNTKTDEAIKRVKSLTTKYPLKTN